MPKQKDIIGVTFRCSNGMNPSMVAANNVENILARHPSDIPLNSRKRNTAIGARSCQRRDLRLGAALPNTSLGMSDVTFYVVHMQILASAPTNASPLGRINSNAVQVLYGRQHL